MYFAAKAASLQSAAKRLVQLPSRPTTVWRALLQHSRLFSCSDCGGSPWSPSSGQSGQSGQSWRRPPAGSPAAVSVDEGHRVLTVTWPELALEPGTESDEAASVLPLAWLRDACQCPACFNAVTRSRSLPFRDFDPRVPVRRAEVSEDSATLNVEWQDGHRSSYARDWLQERSFTQRAAGKRQLIFDRQEKDWQAELAQFQYSEVMNDDSVLLRLLRHLDRQGCLLVRHAPTKMDTLPDFGRRLAGFLASCNYGHTFEVKSKNDPSNAAYTSGYLGLHIDQCFYGRRPGVQILHCISQPNDGSIQGGESLLADGFLAAAMLRRSQPEYFRALTRLPVDFNDYGCDYVGDFHMVNREPVLRLNSYGEVDRVTFSSHSRDYHQNHLPADQIQLLFDALKAFYDTISQPPCVIEHKMETGDIQVTDNRRVLHGRKAFSVRGKAERFLHGSYVEWDELYSRIRRLAERLG